MTKTQPVTAYRMLFLLLFLTVFGAWVWSASYEQPTYERRLATALEQTDQAFKALLDAKESGTPSLQKSKLEAYLDLEKEVHIAESNLSSVRLRTLTLTFLIAIFSITSYVLTITLFKKVSS